ncbi:MAG: lectin-like domain-containing protein [Aureispira sp.]
MNTGSTCLITAYIILSSQLTILIAQPSFTLNGSTIVVSENCYRLTSHQSANDVGSLWCEFPLELENFVDLRFAVNLGCSKYAGEGMAFVMHADKEKYDALGCNGPVMGFGRTNSCKGISPSLALEIDTRYNRNHKDLYQPHLALVKDGNLSAPLLEPVRAKAYGKDVRDCEYHDVRITWQPSKQELCIYFDDELRIQYTKDLVEEIFGGTNSIYFGFTGSTSSRANMQMVCIQSLVIEVDEAFERKRDFEESIGIYPNPLKEKITIDLDLEEEQKVQLQLYNSAGKLVYEIPEHLTQDKKYFFNLPGLPSGVYYVTVTNGSERVSKKVVHITTIRA